MQNVNISGVGTPIFLRLGDRGRTYGRSSGPPLERSAMSSSRTSPPTTVPRRAASSPACRTIQLRTYCSEYQFRVRGRRQLNQHRAAHRRAAGRVSRRLEIGTLPAYGFYCRACQRPEVRQREAPHRHCGPAACADVRRRRSGHPPQVGFRGLARRQGAAAIGAGPRYHHRRLRGPRARRLAAAT